MPPALSDDEASDAGDFPELPMRDGPESGSASADDAPSPPAAPTNGRKTRAKSQPSDVVVEDEEEDEDEEDDEEVEEYIVEAIKQHIIDDSGQIKFQVKWEGYDNKKDLTWEPEENLAETADEILEEYYKSIGGREAAFVETEKAARGKKRGRQSTGAQGAGTKRTRKSAAHPKDTSPPATKKWTPPSGSWEDEIDKIDACEEEGSGKLVVYLNWKNGHKTKHETAVIYKKCPQKMLQFYEKHVRYVTEEKLQAAAAAE